MAAAAGGLYEPSFPSQLWDDTADLRQENPGRAMAGSRRMMRRRDPAGWATITRGALREVLSISSLAKGKGVCAKEWLPAGSQGM